MPVGVTIISHDQEYGTISCGGCKREFVLLNVIRSAADDTSIVQQDECDYCPFCGRKEGE